MEVERTYKNGNIISLSLTNFQTFKSSVINFSPSLNFIIGPNGSGKSTISNAISLIFGGTPKTIGKTKNIKEYIKFGEHDCKIEAEIFYEGQNIKIGRGFSIANNFWYINGSVVKKNIYEAFIDKLNINVNNLCQYLPQEKVSEFCRMSSEELLINTLLSLNKDSIVETLTYLNEIEHKLNDTSARESCLKKQKEELESMVEKINKDVVKMEERDYKVKRIDMLESKRTWVEYDDVVKDYKRLENSIKVLERNFGNNEKEVQDIVKQIENIENNPQNIVLQNKILELDEWDGKLESIKDEIRSLNNEKGLLDIDLEYLNKKREKRAEKLNHLKTELESSKEELDRVKEGILEKKDLIRADDDEGSVKRSKTEELTYISHVRNIDTLFQKYDTQPINEQEDEIFKLKRQAQIIQQKCIDVKKVVDELEDKKRRSVKLKKEDLNNLRNILMNLIEEFFG
jgi:structural maintenance of chromosomes protein 5